MHLKQFSVNLHQPLFPQQYTTALHRVMTSCNVNGTFDTGLILGLHESESEPGDLIFTQSIEDINKRTADKPKGREVVKKTGLAGRLGSSIVFNNVDRMAWRYQDFKEIKNRKPTPSIKLYGSADTEVWTRGISSVEAQCLVRALCKNPAHLFPQKNTATIHRAMFSCNVNGTFDTRLILGLYESGCESSDPIFTQTAEDINKRVKIKNILIIKIRDFIFIKNIFRYEYVRKNNEKKRSKM